MADFLKMFQQVQDFQKNMERTKEELDHMTISGSAGGGMVTAEVTGQLMLKRIKLDPSAVNTADLEMLEDLVVVAVADAQKKAQQIAQERLAQIAGGMNLPFKLPI